ncbi:MAG: ribosome-binding factor A [Candidatus Brennerbacteria bacterium]|nr:ribosome-binding factor A [Candidatus Brennerbacteria bacterium]
MNYRNLRVAKLIKEELSEILMKELEFENALITINEVNVYKDLLNAKVRLGVLPVDKAPNALKIIAKQAGFLRKLLLKKINIKPMPYLSFEIDRGAEAAADFDKAFLKSKNK